MKKYDDADLLNVIKLNLRSMLKTLSFPLYFIGNLKIHNIVYLLSGLKNSMQIKNGHHVMAIFSQVRQTHQLIR